MYTLNNFKGLRNIQVHWMFFYGLTLCGIMTYFYDTFMYLVFYDFYLFFNELM